MTTLETNGITLNYEDTGGDGRAVVLIHGWPLSGASWSAQKEVLVEAGYRVIAYDRRGFGASDKPEDGYDYDTFAADLAGLLESLDVEDATLVGFSMGGGEVARYLANHGGDRVRSGVFAGAVPPYLLKTDDNPDGGLSDDDVEGMQNGARSNREEFLRDFLTNFYSANGELAVSQERVDASYELSTQASDEAVVACIAAFGRTDFRGDVSSISQPCLVIHGSADAVVPFEVSGQRTAEMLENSTLVVVENGPHGFNVSHAEEFNRALLDFLAR
ncbi:alpha/beta hydrolase [Nocardioides anomalus]|uniref:Alpha/beta hydrolase n=1 Tax=Nocardioides anomalus TaxID=2712223 RepID=A0A6G6WAQ0_9ACTN|nr:alpha/beta hydrolase [Nocardioides anomalus]QIG42312.1 alpha/beta hydrolase [Nocardioides anomalus]